MLYDSHRYLRDASQRKDACQKPEIAIGELHSLKKNEDLEPKNPLELQRIWVNINTKLISFFFHLDSVK